MNTLTLTQASMRNAHFLLRPFLHKEAKVWRKVEPYNPRGWAQLPPPQAPLHYDVSEKETSILFSYFGLKNSPLWVVQLSQPASSCPKSFLLHLNSPFSWPLLQWHDSSLWPLISENALFGLYDSQGGEHNTEFLIWSRTWLVQNKTESSPFSQMVCFYWCNLWCLSTSPICFLLVLVFCYIFPIL